MSHSSKPRVKRKHNPKKFYTQHTYRKALPMLLDDFGARCAYSLMHVRETGSEGMHVDHFNPSKKRKSSYSNLYPAYSLCNGAKQDWWPSSAEQRNGIRYLDPCKETDYDEQIFEDPNTHHLIGSTKAARYHIEMLDLNHPTLVLHRTERSQLRAILASPMIATSGSPEADLTAATIGHMLLAILSHKIPVIKAPPADLVA